MSDKHPSAVIIPFGKHKGATVAEILEKDPSYAQWLLGQGWLAERFAELHAAIVTRGAGTDDTPEHNALQARFLDPLFRAATLLSALGADSLDVSRRQSAGWIAELRSLDVSDAERRLSTHDIHGRYERNDPARRAIWDAERPSIVAQLDEARASKSRPIALALQTCASFEVRGVDVLVHFAFGTKVGDTSPNDNPNSAVAIELKPSLGDDFPSVMRQMARLRARVLVVGDYAGRAVPFPDLRKMFEANRTTLLTVQDVEAETAEARALLELQTVGGGR